MHLIEAEGQFSVTVGTALILWVPVGRTLRIPKGLLTTL